METLQHYTTSEIARIKFEAMGKSKKHREIIIDTLEKCEYSLSAFDMAKCCELSYEAIDRRMCELRRAGKVEIDRRKIDMDGAWRNAYKIVK